MRVRVLLFGQLRDIVGRGEDSLELAPGACMSAVTGYYSEKFPKFKPISGSIACSLNQEYAPASAKLKDGDEVGLLPPVSGGKESPRSPSPPTAPSSETGADRRLPADLRR